MSKETGSSFNESDEGGHGSFRGEAGVPQRPNRIVSPDTVGANERAVNMSVTNKGAMYLGLAKESTFAGELQVRGS